MFTHPIFINAFVLLVALIFGYPTHYVLTKKPPENKWREAYMAKLDSEIKNDRDAKNKLLDQLNEEYAMDSRDFYLCPICLKHTLLYYACERDHIKFWDYTCTNKECCSHESPAPCGMSEDEIIKFNPILLTTAAIDKIIKERYNNYKPAIFRNLRGTHELTRKLGGEYEFLKFLHKCQTDNPKPEYNFPEEFNKLQKSESDEPII